MPVNLSMSPCAVDTKHEPQMHCGSETQKERSTQWPVAFIGQLNRDEDSVETEDFDHSELSSSRQVMLSG